MVKLNNRQYKINGRFIAKKGAYGDTSNTLLFNFESGEMLYIDECSHELLKLIQAKVPEEEALVKLGLSRQEADLFFDTLATEKLITREGEAGKIDEKTPHSGYRNLDHVNMILTETCNYKCSFCYRESSPTARGSMAERDALLAIDAFDQLGVIDVSLSGGEPLLVPYIYDYIDELRDRKYHVNLQTNLSLVDERSPLLEGHAPHKITTSCDSLVGDGHSLEKIESALELILSKGIEVAVNITILPNLVSKGELSRLLDRLMGIGINDLSIGSAIPSNQFTVDDFHKSFSYIELVKDMKKRECVASEEVLSDSAENRRDSYAAFPYLVCGAGDYNCCIDWKKRMHPCPALHSFHINMSDIKEFPRKWSEKGTFSTFRDPLALLQECKSCCAFFVCKGGCKAKSLAIFKQLQAPDPWSCAIFKQNG